MEFQNLRVSKYIVGDVLGKGTSGEVRLGEDPDTSAKVAIKFFDRRRQTRTELHAYKAIGGHPNILKLLDYELYPESELSPYLILEYMPQDLYSFIEDSRSVPVFKIFDGILAGLKAIHSSGIAHGDLKLENIFVDEDSNVKIGDFGLSTPSRIGKMHAFKGSINYMPPEILEQRPYDPVKADVFSCGVILFILLMGHFPFTRACKKDRYYRYIYSKKHDTYWESFNRSISTEMQRLVESMLSYEPSERPNIECLINYEK